MFEYSSGEFMVMMNLRYRKLCTFKHRMIKWCAEESQLLKLIGASGGSGN